MNVKINRNPQDISLTLNMLQTMMPQARKETEKIAKKLVDKNGKNQKSLIKATWEYQRKNYKYHADPIGIELIRMPSVSYLIKNQGIDCEDFSLMAAAIFLNLGIACRYRVVDFTGDGWSHIYLIATTSQGREIVVDAVNAKFNKQDKFIRFEDLNIGKSALKISGLGGLDKMPMLPFPKNGLGLLPKDLWTDRERIILLIWDDMLLKGSVSDKINRTYSVFDTYGRKIASRNESVIINTIPEELKTVDIGYYKDLSRGEIKTGELLQIEDKETKVKLTKIYLELYDGTKFSFILEYTARLAEKIAGSSVLVLKREKPISENEKKVFDALIKLVSNDKLRPAMTGVYFDKERQKIMATNGHYMTIIDLKVTIDGIYNKTFKQLEESPLNYLGVLPDYEPIAEFPIYFDNLLQRLEIMKKFMGKTYLHTAAFQLYLDKITGINIPFFVEQLKVFKNIGFKEGTVKIYAENKPLVFTGMSDLGEVTALMMPTHIKFKNMEYKTILEENIAFQDVNNESKIIVGMWSFEERAVFGGVKGYSSLLYDESQKNKKPSQSTAQAQRIRILALKYKYQKAS
jgi:hypothetical protein